ncbi:MAG: glycosyltransferase, partial [Acidimicrobiia bacterium]
MNDNVAGAVRTIRSVGVVVVNFNGGRMVEQCVRSLLATDWDPGLEIVVVDNASTDGSDEVLALVPGVRVVQAGANLGYAVANNIGLRELRGCDAVALVNPDAFVTPGWLGPLVAACTGDTDGAVGAACPKIVFEPVFTEVRLSSPVFVPGGADQRTLGLRVTGVIVDGADVYDRCEFVDGWSWPEDHARWTTGDARLFVPVTPSSTSVDVIVEGEPVSRNFQVTERFDVINNAGNELTPDWYGRDRGFLEIDRGQYDTASDVWGWCGAAVLLTRAYLDATTGFDERFFLYYEDVEWAWRGRKQGWRYAYVPSSVVRHRHSATTVQGSALFDHLN